MIVYILRHGQAEPLLGSDHERVLTQRGINDVRGAAQCLAEKGPLPQKILFSPFVRTTQTRDTVMEVLGDIPCQSSSALLSESTPDAVDLLMEQQDDQVILLISHQPLVSYLLGHWLAANPGDRSVPGLSPAALVQLELSTPASGCGSLSYWAMPPDYQRQQ